MVCVGGWHIQIIFTQRNHYGVQVSVYAECCLHAHYVHGCNHACNLWRPGITLKGL